MIAIDADVLVRFLTQANEAQARAASDFMAGLNVSNHGFICREVSYD